MGKWVTSAHAHRAATGAVLVLFIIAIVIGSAPLIALGAIGALLLFPV